MPPHKTSDVESVLINLIFHAETMIDIAENESGRRKNVKVIFEDDPITIIVVDKNKPSKIEVQNIVSVVSEARQSGGAIAIRYRFF